jgi:hypothetical protein
MQNQLQQMVQTKANRKNYLRSGWRGNALWEERNALGRWWDRRECTFFVVLFPYVETQQTIFSTMVIEPPAMLANSHTSV